MEMFRNICLFVAFGLVVLESCFCVEKTKFKIAFTFSKEQRWLAK